VPKIARGAQAAGLEWGRKDSQIRQMPLRAADYARKCFEAGYAAGITAAVNHLQKMLPEASK
jgi:hypothetical protein